ncbi:hypothetical protein B9K06_27465, partial [Bacillus sp. OG2]
GGVMYPGGATGYMTERKKRVSCTPKSYWIHDQVKNGGVMYPGGVTGYMVEQKKRVSCIPKRLLDT